MPYANCLIDENQLRKQEVPDNFQVNTQTNLNAQKKRSKTQNKLTQINQYWHS